MRSSRYSVSGSCIRAALGLLAVAAIFAPLSLAQSPGNNAVYAPSGGGTAIVGSTAYIDASAIAGTGGATDICAKINAALSTLSSSTGAVIDARGISGSTNLTCTGSNTPWVYTSVTVHAYNVSSVILLPSGTISIQSTWILPNKTRLIGEGSGASGSALTTIQAASTFTDPDSNTSSGGTGGPSIIRMGTTTFSSLSCGSFCFAVGVENLAVDGQNQASLSGITNVASQELSYVNEVDLYRIAATGLQIGYIGNTKAQNSGPYSNVRFEGSTSSSAACAQIIGASSTRGIRGATCNISSSVGAPVGIYFDSSSNVIQDVSISGFSEGIRIGQSAQAESDALINISGNLVGYLVHICSVGGTCSGSGAQDIVAMALSYSTCTGTCYTILDDTASTQLKDPTLTMYTLGEAISGGYSRFTTSTRVPTWIVGSTAPSGACITTGLSPNGSNGTLFSNTNGGSSSGCGLGNTLYVCANGTWTNIR